MKHTKQLGKRLFSAFAALAMVVTMNVGVWADDLDGAGEQSTPQAPAVCNCITRCRPGAPNTNCPVCRGGADKCAHATGCILTKTHTVPTSCKTANDCVCTIRCGATTVTACPVCADSINNCNAHAPSCLLAANHTGACLTVADCTCQVKCTPASSACTVCKTRGVCTHSAECALTTYHAGGAACKTAAQLQEEQDVKDAQSVTAKIAGIGTVLLENESAIKTAESAYAALNQNAKGKVANYDTLTAARAQWNTLKADQDKKDADKNAADKVTALIAALPEKSAVTEAHKAAIESAYTNYNNLTGDQKSLVGDLTRLTDAKKALDDLAAQKAAEEQAAQADQTAANAVIDLIGKLPASVQTTDEAAITAARDAYNALSPAQKALVTNLSALVSAEAALADAKKPQEEQSSSSTPEKTEDQKKAEEVAALIEKLPAKSSVSLADEAKINEAEAAYGVLTTTQQALITAGQKQRLDDAVAQLKEVKAADSVVKEINALPDKAQVKLADKDKIEAARVMHTRLTDAQRTIFNGMMPDISRLNDAMARIAELTQEMEAFRKLIDELPGTITLTDGVKITDARGAYNKLTDEQKALLSVEEAKLKNAEEQYRKQKADADWKHRETCPEKDYPASLHKTDSDCDRSIERVKVARDAVSAVQDPVTKETVPQVDAAEKAYKALLTDAERDALKDLKDKYEKALAQRQEVLNPTFSHLEACPDKTNSAHKAAAECESAIRVDTFKKAVNAVPAKLTTAADLRLLDTAREAYGKLTTAESDKLEAALKAKYDDAVAAAEIVKGVIDLPNPPKLANKARLVELVDGYNKMTDVRKRMVGNVDLMEKYTLLLKAADLINNLPELSRLTTAHESAVNAAKAAYDSLANKADLEAPLKEKLDASVKRVALLRMEAQLNALPVQKDVTLSHEQAVKDAEAAYDKFAYKGDLNASAKTRLTQARAKIDAIKVENLISGLPSEGSLTLSHKNSVDAIKEAYDKLPDKNLINSSMKDKLSRAVSRIDALYNARTAEAVVGLINNLIPVDKLTASDYSKVEIARRAYDELSSSEKKKVTNEDVLRQAEKRMNDIPIADVATSVINVSSSVESNRTTREMAEQMARNGNVKDRPEELAKAVKNADPGDQVSLKKDINSIALDSKGKPSNVRFEVKPQIKESGTTSTIPNRDLDGRIPVRLPLPSSFNQPYAYITHYSSDSSKSTEGGYYQVYNQGRSDAYVEVWVTHFSEFTVEPTSWRPSSSSGGSSGGSGSTSSSIEKAHYEFWEKVKDSIYDADDGDVIRAVATNALNVPTSVLRELEGRDVTLVIKYKGREIVIYGDDMIKVPKSQVFYTFEDLEDLYDGYYDDRDDDDDSSDDESSSSKTNNPVTGGSNYVPGVTVPNVTVNPTPPVIAPVTPSTGVPEISKPEDEEDEDDGDDEDKDEPETEAVKPVEPDDPEDKPAEENRGGAINGVLIAIIVGAVALVAGVVTLGVYFYRRNSGDDLFD